MTLPELNHFLVGEKLVNGATLYVSLWEDIAPFSAGVYMIIDYIFGKSLWVYHILGFLLIFFQAALFNQLTVNNKAYNDNTYLPAMVYAVLMSTSFDMYTLSPILMSATFILMALSNIFSQVEFRIKKDERILNIGLNLGLASMFYFPSVIFVFVTFIVLAIYSNTVGRRYLLVLYGSALPVLIVVTYYFVVDGLEATWHIFVTKLFNIDKANYLNLQSRLLLIALPLLFLLLAIVRIIQKVRYSNYQVRLVQLMLVWLLLSLIMLIWAENMITSFILFVPAAAFIITHYFLLIRGVLKAELLFGIFWIGIIFLNTSSYFQWFSLDKYIAYDNLIVRTTQYDEVSNNKKIIVLGDDLNIYKNSSLATPFLDWGLSQEVLTNPEYYDNATSLYHGFYLDPPDLIIDKEELMPALRERVVFLEKEYESIGNGMYERKIAQ